MDKKSRLEAIVFVGLIAAGAWLRCHLQDLPNFAPVAAMALFAGYFFRSTFVALCVPLLVMGISDMWIGGYNPVMMAIVYVMLGLPVALRWLLRRHFHISGRKRWSASLAVAGLLTCTLGTSLAFFLVTNLGHWMLYDMYPHTPLGLVRCYVQAIPFFRYTLAGDLLFGLVLFGGYAFAVVWAAAREKNAAVVT